MILLRQIIIYNFDFVLISKYPFSVFNGKFYSIKRLEMYRPSENSFVVKSNYENW